MALLSGELVSRDLDRAEIIHAFFDVDLHATLTPLLLFAAYIGFVNRTELVPYTQSDLPDRQISDFKHTVFARYLTAAGLKFQAAAGITEAWQRA